MKSMAYFGGSQAKGSKNKVLQLSGMGMIPFGGALSSFGVMSQSPQGSGMSLGGGMTPFGGGMTLLGTGIGRWLKQLAKPLAKGAKSAILNIAKNAASNIKNPIVKTLATQGLDVGSRMVDEALSGNRNIQKYRDIGMSGLKQAVPALIKSVSGSGAGSGYSKKMSKQIQPDISLLGAVDRPLKYNTLNTATANKKLVILSDVIHSAPVNTRVQRPKKGGGMYNF